MRAHDCCVDHGIFIVGILRQMLKNPGPNAGFGPAAEAQVHDAEIAEALGQIAPGYARAIPVQHRLDKKPIVLGSHADGSFAPGKQVPDALPLIIAQRMTTRRRSAPPIRPTAYESREAILGNLAGYVRIKPGIDDRP